VDQDGGRPAELRDRTLHARKELRHSELQGKAGLLCTGNHNLPGSG